METINQALETISRAVYEEQRQTADMLHRLLNTAWIIHNAAQNGNREARTALATDWPTLPQQSVDDVLDELERRPVETPETDPETVARLNRLSEILAGQLPPPLPGDRR